MDDDPLGDILGVSLSPSPSSQEYLTHLTTLPLTSLVSEPAALQTQSHHLTSSLTSLTHTSYPTFLALHDTTTALVTALDSIDASLSALLASSLPALEAAAAAWHTRTDAVLRDRGKARSVLEQHDKIKDLLDVPIFIDTCVRNGYFAEALALAAHAMSLGAPTTPHTDLSPAPPPILASVQAEVHRSIMHMRLTLLAILHEPSRKLPALWKAVNFLRKMDAFGASSAHGKGVEKEHGYDYGGLVSSEEQLALAFLSGRLGCLAGSLDPISRDIHRLVDNTVLTPATNGDDSGAGRVMSDRDKEDVARYLKKYVDVWREGAYDIVTQYSTIFLEHGRSHVLPTSISTPTSMPAAPLSPSSSSPTLHSHPTPLSTHNSLTDPNTLPLQTTLPALPALLSAHLLQTHLFPMLQTALPLLPLPLLPSLLTQLTYCSSAFARVGLDFHTVLARIVEQSVVDSVTRELRAAGTAWVHGVEAACGGDSGTHAPRKGGAAKARAPSAWLVSPAHPDAPPPSRAAAQRQGPPHIPPPLLGAYPPLAEHTNALLGVLNALRLLAPVSVLGEVLDVLEGVLAEGGRALGEYVRRVEGGVEVGGRGGGSVDGEERDGDRSWEKEQGIARAVGECYFRVFVPFVRRGLVEGVYGIKEAEWDGWQRSRDGDGNDREDPLGEALREWEVWSNGEGA